MFAKIFYIRKKFPVYILENFKKYSSLSIKQQIFFERKLNILVHLERKLCNYSVVVTFTLSIRFPFSLYVTTRASLDGFASTLKLEFVTKYFEIFRVWIKSDNWRLTWRHFHICKRLDLRSPSEGQLARKAKAQTLRVMQLTPCKLWYKVVLSRKQNGRPPQNSYVAHTFP